VTAIEDWWAGGETLQLPLGGTEREVFLRRAGEGPVLTALHGFPSSSHDWSKIAPALAERNTVVMPDLLGFGASAKPADHAYSLREQTDLVEAVWRALGVESTAILAHDYSVSILQELLARRAEDGLEVALTRATLFNGGLYPDIHRPQPTQLALLDPVRGPKLGELMTEELFVAGLRPTFADGYDADEDSAEIWRSYHRSGGERISHLLIGYIPERERTGDRWVGALESTDVPLSFVWGMLDPVSGAHMAARIRERLPEAPFAALDDVGHWPQLEAPRPVLEALMSA
jgi:pimeloyl-ACP methyl ester carboxylesterase